MRVVAKGGRLELPAIRVMREQGSGAGLLTDLNVPFGDHTSRNLLFRCQRQHLGPAYYNPTYRQLPICKAIPAICRPEEHLLRCQFQPDKIYEGA